MIDKKPLSEMSEEEILAEIRNLRDRRAQAAIRSTPATRVNAKPVPKKPSELTGNLSNLLDDILGGSVDNKETP